MSISPSRTERTQVRHTPGPRYGEHAAACRRARIVREATRNRTGGIALLTALVDTPHQRTLVADLGTALFPDGEEARA